MVMSFRMVSEAVSTFNVLRKLRLWRERSVQRFCPSTWALLAAGKTQHHTDIALSDSMGFSFSPQTSSVSGVRILWQSHWDERARLKWVGCLTQKMTVGELWSIQCNQPPPTAMITQSLNIGMDRLLTCADVQSWDTLRSVCTGCYLCKIPVIFPTG